MARHSCVQALLHRVTHFRLTGSNCATTDTAPKMRNRMTPPATTDSSRFLRDGVTAASAAQGCARVAPTAVVTPAASFSCDLQTWQRLGTNYTRRTKWCKCGASAPWRPQKCNVQTLPCRHAVADVVADVARRLRAVSQVSICPLSVLWVCCQAEYVSTSSASGSVWQIISDTC